METIKQAEVDEEERSLVHKLPSELWGEIGVRLGNKLDILRFRSTCKSWRSSLPSSHSIFPLLIPTPPSSTNGGNCDYRYVITENTAYACEFSSSTQQNPVLVVFESRGLTLFTPCTLYGGYLSNRLTSAQHTWFLTALNKQQYSISSQLFKTYHVQSFSVGKRIPGVRTTYVPTALINQVVLILYERNSHKPVSIEKLAYYSNGLDNNGVNLAVVALLPLGGLMFWSNSSQCQSSTQWKPITTTTTTTTTYKIEFDDIVNYQGKCWAIDRNGETFVLDTKSLCMAHVTSLPKETLVYNDKGRKRLVEVSGELYMLFPCMDRGLNNKSNIIKVFQMKESGWVEVSGLGNYIFFVGVGFSCGILARRELWFSNDEAKKYNDGNCIFLDRLSFCRTFRSSVNDTRKDDYPLFKEMTDYKGSFGVYDKVCDKFKGISEQDLPEIYLQ